MQRVHATYGDWTVYPTVDHYWRIEQIGNHYYLLNGNSLVVADVEHPDQYTTLSRLDGLNGNIIVDIVANESLQKLAIVYNDGNIDLMDISGKVINLPDYANYSIAGDRSISGIGMEETSLYVQTGFGGFVVDMDKAVIRDTWYNDIEDNQSALAHCIEVVSAHKNSDALSKILDNMQLVNGTQVQQASQMRFMHGRLYAAQGTFNDYVNYQWGTPVVSILNTENGDWTNISASDIEPKLKQIDKNAKFHKLTGIAVHPNQPDKVAVSSLEGGIYIIAGDTLSAYYNAYLQPDGMTSIFTTSDAQKTTYTRVGAVNYDEKGYLWFSNGDKESETTLRCLTPTNQFIKLKTPGFTGHSNGHTSIIGRLFHTYIGQYQLKWMLRTFHINSAAICVVCDKGTPEDLSDDQSALITTITDQDGNKYDPTYFRDLVADKEGILWLLTSVGPFVIDDQVQVLNNSGNVRRIKIPRNDGTNLADYLLGEVSCRCMVVDAANRKWIGTDESGLYLLSADGMTQLEHFTTDNSPLYSNRIAGLTMDDETGTLYIGTDGGICAYETDVLREVSDNSELYCYPNPVRPEYTGNLNIAGFKNGSTITVTDVTHHAVFREKSDGSIIHWNLEGNDGQRLRPGVYYIDAIEEDGKKGGSFKFLVL